MWLTKQLLDYNVQYQLELMNFQQLSVTFHFLYFSNYVA